MNDMKIIDNPFYDPFGRRAGLTRALNEWFDASLVMSKDQPLEEWAANVFIAWGRCLVYGIDPEQSDLVRIDERLRSVAIRGLVFFADTRSVDATTLPSVWDVTDDCWEADDACLDVLRHRTELWGAELALLRNADDAPNELTNASERYDQALLPAMSVIATLQGSTSFENFICEIDPKYAKPLPWWLGEGIEDAAKQNAIDIEAAIPPPSVMSQVHYIQKWQSQLPVVDAMERTLSGFTKDRNRPASDFKTVHWKSPDDDQVYAELLIPTEYSNQQEIELRPLSIHRRCSDGSAGHATEFAGQTVRLGQWAGVLDKQAIARLTLKEIREGCEGLLWVNELPNAWKVTEAKP
jgi:hypothetical protein